MSLRSTQSSRSLFLSLHRGFNSVPPCSRHVGRLTRSTASCHPPSIRFLSSSTTPDATAEQAGPSTPSTVKDPDHPYLWYHQFLDPSPGRIALSFLPAKPLLGSRTVLGYLPIDSESGLNDFQESPDFLKLLHVLVKDGLQRNLSESILYEASTRPTDGYMNINDERALPPAGRIAEPEDILGSVYVENGQVNASTYEPLPSYRLVTPNGPLILPKGLDGFVRERLADIDQEEKAS